MSEIMPSDTVEYLLHLEAQIDALSKERTEREQRMLWAASRFKYGDVIECNGNRIKCDRVHSWSILRDKIRVAYVEGHKLKKDGSLSQMKGRVYDSDFEKWKIVANLESSDG